MNIVLLASNWAAEAGGINVFNCELAVALSEELHGRGRVFCALPRWAVPAGRTLGVEMIPLDGLSREHVSEASIQTLETWWRQRPAGEQPPIWVGHDVITGPLANAAAAKVGGASVVIHHMSYAAYELFKGDTAAHVEARIRSQRNVLNDAGKVLAVGPLLQRSAVELTGRAVGELIPGFPTFAPGALPENAAFTAITFGRLGVQDDRVKQGSLAAASFGRAIRSAADAGRGTRRLSQPRPRLYVVGLDEEGNEEANLKRLAADAAGRAVNVHALPFETDRCQILDRLRRADLSMMLSWHEGFGLAGWEAVAAGVPLILTKHSGLYELIERELSDAGLACVRPVDVEGRIATDGDTPFTQRDEEAVQEAILSISDDLPRAKQNALLLRELMTDAMDCSWRGTAKELLRAIGDDPVRVGDISPRGKSRNVSAQQLSELAAKFQIEAWVGLSSAERLGFCRELERANAGTMQLRQLASYRAGPLQIEDVPTFLHMESGVEFQLVLGGIFTMGLTDWPHEHEWCRSRYRDWRKGWSTRSTPAHRRRIRPYFMGRFPVLQEEWDRFKADARLRDKRTSLHPRNPLDGVSWHDLQRYLALTQLRLPSEAEWEWACNAGSATRFFWGEEIDPAFCWYAENALRQVHSVDEHARCPNAFGLVDMLGNVWEWCADDWAPAYAADQHDSRPWLSAIPEPHAVQRGGGWNNSAPTCRTRFRSHWAREDRLENTGFRAARDLF